MPTIDNFKANLKLGGFQPTNYEVELNFPGYAGSLAETEQMKFMCKAATLPASTTGIINVPYRGRDLKMAGDREFADWTVTVTQDGSFNIRDALEKWSNEITNHENIGGLSNPDDYFSTATVSALSKNGEVLKSYTFNYLWPSNIGELSMGFDQKDTLAEFECTLTYTTWEASTTS